MTNFSLDQSYNYCRKIALGHYENFPIGSILIPKRLRPHFFALYAFMRTADDFADLPHRSKEERLALLADWKHQLDEALLGSEPEHPIFIALRNTITQCKLSSRPLYRLLEAFEFDAKGEVHFETFEDLRWYTSRSADPVGELVLALFGYADAERIKASNEICSALQLLNFIQDIKEDLANNRFYYPEEDSGIFGVRAGVGQIEADRLSLLSLFEIERVESLLDRGVPLAESVGRRLRYELRAIIRAARKMIKKIRKQSGYTYLIRPTLSKWEHLMILLQSLLFQAR
ncbi:MAG: squalene/phytoene synthase family protein [Ignavibacteriota bacterium]